MNAGSLFTGIGQLDFGLHLAGIEHSWFCESDPWRREILEKRWPGVPVFDDVRAVTGSAPSVDLLVGGFPCRGASTAGKREGMGNPETAFWREMARILSELRPRLCLLENVAALLAVDGGRSWGEVVGDLESLGYVGAWDCLPAAAFGAPHLRDRAFGIAALADAGEGGFRPGQQHLRTRGEQPDAERSDEDAPDSRCSALRQQPESEQGGGGETKPGIAAEGVGPCGCFWGVIDGGGFCACCEAHINDPDGLYALQGDGTHKFASCSASAHSPRLRQGGPEASAGPERERAGGDAPPRDWGDYGPAIRRWEEVAGPAPEPLLRGLDDGDARRVVRSRLSAHGDGVQCQAGLFLGQRILAHFEYPQQCERERVAA